MRHADAKADTMHLKVLELRMLAHEFNIFHRALPCILSVDKPNRDIMHAVLEVAIKEDKIVTSCALPVIPGPIDPLLLHVCAFSKRIE